jgi:peptide/nickel transport system substrate-binding protein
MKRRSATLVAASVTLALGVSACGGGSSGGENKGGSSNTAAFNAAIGKVFNPSDKKGGTMKFAISSDWDSTDPGDTYYGLSWNLSRLYTRALTMFKVVPGSGSTQMVGDLAEGLGTPSDGGKTWTYKLRQGLKFEDGTPITSKDVKYAIERSNFAPEALSNGPTYFKAYLKGGDKYKGPYKDKKGLDSIATPDDQTIVFHLAKPFADFDYLATFSQTAPVPQAKDDGAKYVQHIVSSGPYKFASYEEGASASLVRNPNWDPKTDPIRKALPDKINVKFKVNPVTVDNDLLADKITADITGAGVQPQTQPKVLNGKYAKQTDNSYAGATGYMALNLHVAPFDNVHCRKAVQWALDKQSVIDAMGGAPKGDVATTLLPPSVNGYTKFDTYATAGHKGDAAKAKDELKQCGKPNGFSTTLTARSDRPAEVAAATAIQNSLKGVGINVDIKQFPSGKYFSNFAGVPSYVHQHKLGMMMMAWGADWPTGYGFLDQIIDGSAIKPSGGNNLMELDDPKINKALSDAIANTDSAARTKAWGDIDKMVLDNASVVPLIYRKNLLIRPTSATNVTVTQAYLGMYDYTLLGSSK